MKKRMIFFAYNLDYGGIEKALINLLNRLDYTKYEVKLVLEKKDGVFLPFLNKNIKVEAYKVSCDSNFVIRKLKNFMKRFFWSIKNYHKYDFSCCYATYSKIGSKLSLTSSVNSSIYVHNEYKIVYPDIKDYKEFFDTRNIAKFKNIVFVSNESMDNFVNIYNELKDRCLVINNFNDEDEIISLSKEKISEKKTKKNLFLYVGRLDEKQKKISRIIHLAKHLKNNNYSAQFFIVGDGQDKKLYEKLIKELQVEDVVKLLGARSNPYPYFKLADYFLLTSDYEGFPVTYMEAIILKKKIITTMDLSDSDISIPGNHGYIISKNIKKMCTEVEEILKNDNLKYKNIDIKKLNVKKMKKLEAMFDGDKNAKV